MAYVAVIQIPAPTLNRTAPARVAESTKRQALRRRSRHPKHEDRLAEGRIRPQRQAKAPKIVRFCVMRSCFQRHEI